MRTGAVVAGALIALASAFAGVYGYGVAREAWTHVRAERAWPDQRARLEAAVAAVELPDGYRRVDCAADAVVEQRCWRVDALPDDVLPDQLATLDGVGDTGAVGDCDGTPTWRGRPVGCAVSTILAGRLLGATAFRDVDPDASHPDDVVLDSTLVGLGADLTPP